jgi:hypothetical protein
VPVPPDAPQRKGQLLDFIEALKRHRAAPPAPRPKEQPPAPAARKPAAARSLPVAVTAVETVSELALPSAPSVLRRKRAKPRRGWRSSVRRWGSVTFRLAMAVLVSSLAVAYEQHIRPLPAGGPAGDKGGASGQTKAAAPVMLLNGHRGAVIAVASTDEDRWIVSAGADATIRVWSARSGGEVNVIGLPEGAVTAFAVDRHRALAGHKNGVVALWDLENGKQLATFSHGTDTITSVAFIGDRFAAARQDGGVALFDLGAPEKPPVLLDALERGGNLIAASRARGLLVTTGSDRTVRLWRGPEPHLFRTYHLVNDWAAVDIAPDAGYVAGGSIDGVVRIQRSPSWLGPRPHSVQMFKAHEGRVTAIALGPAGMLASAGQDGSLKLWTLQPQRVMRALEGGQVRTLSFSRDGRRLLAGGQDGAIRVWQVAAPPSGAM